MGDKGKKKRDEKQKKATKASGGKAKKGSRLAPKPVETGKGATPLEIARDFVALLRAGKADEVEAKWLASRIESLEGLGVSLAWSGKKAVQAKYRAWEADHEIHEMRIDGPWVGATGFALRYWIDVTTRSTGERSQLEEIAVYKVKNGKVVREEFHFAAGG